MRAEYRLFTGMGLFMVPLAALYVFWSREEIGSLLLVITAVSFVFVGVYLFIQARRLDGPRPEDYSATPADGAGEVGSFPVGSIWPLVAASGVTLTTFGLVFNGFIVVPGLSLIVISIIGMARESTQAGLGHAPLDHNTHPEAKGGDTFTDMVKK